MREKLIELHEGSLRYAGDVCGETGDCSKCQYDKYGANCGYAIRADYLIANGVTIAKWIPVTERLPEKHGETYLCLYTFPNSKESFPYCLHWHAYGSNGFVDGPHFSDEGIAGMKVTHWMPIPSVEGLK